MYVNNAKKMHANLKHGDTVQIGNFRFIIFVSTTETELAAFE